jgi:tRNA(Ile)-lysidine synthase
MEKVSYKNSYKIFKPLLDYSKDKLIKYLKLNNIKFFNDKSNMDEKYKRNYFRHNFSDKLIKKYETGIKNSFNYLENDLNSLFDNIKVEKVEELSIYIFNGDLNIAIRLIDKDLKTRGIIISSATRLEIINKKEITVAHKIAISITDTKIYIAPIVDITMNKKFREKCRVNKIPKNIRNYIFLSRKYKFIK